MANKATARDLELTINEVWDRLGIECAFAPNSNTKSMVNSYNEYRPVMIAELEKKGYKLGSIPIGVYKQIDENFVALRVFLMDNAFVKGSAPLPVEDHNRHYLYYMT